MSGTLIIRAWDSGFGRKISNGIYDPREDKKVTFVTIAGYAGDNEDKFTLNKWTHGLLDPWLLKINLLIQPNNDENKWMHLFKLKKIGYQYVTRTYKVKTIHERKLRGMIDVLTSGFMRKNGMIRIGDIIQIISRNIEASIVIFCQLYIKADPIPPKLQDLPIRSLTSGFMRKDGINIIGLHKLTSKYINKVSGMYLKWDRTCLLSDEAIEGDSEWNFDI